VSRFSNVQYRWFANGLELGDINAPYDFMNAQIAVELGKEILEVTDNKAQIQIYVPDGITRNASNTHRRVLLVIASQVMPLAFAIIQNGNISIMDAEEKTSKKHELSDPNLFATCIRELSKLGLDRWIKNS